MSVSVIQVHRFAPAFRDTEGRCWTIFALGARRADGQWIGWLEFVADTDEVRATGRETTQTTLDALVYWATGLEPTYLEGAFDRAVAMPCPAVPPTGERLVA